MENQEKLSIKKTPYYVIHLVKHGKGLFNQTPEEESKSQKRVNALIKAWHPRVCQSIGLHCLGIADEWDWIGVFSVASLADWVAFREELHRCSDVHIDKFLSLPGVSHDEFTKATSSIEHYKKLRALDTYPGGAEVYESKKSQ